MRTRICLLFIALTLTGSAFSQNAEKQWSIGPDLGFVDYAGDLGNFMFKFNSGLAIGGSVFKYLNPSFDAGVHLFVDDVSKSDVNNLFPGYGFNFTAKYLTLKAELKYKFANGYILKEDARLQPFVKLAAGVYSTNSSGVGTWGPHNNFKEFSTVYAAGPGLTIPLGKTFAIDLYSVLNWPTNADYIDLISNENPAIPLANSLGDVFLHTAVGLRVNLGAAKDADKDGIPDKKDMCPDTPEGVAVDENGCPLDGDGDGVPDYLDECPTEKGLAQFNGCPDSDGDGIPDKDDECPDVAGLKVFNGCPDSDGDGVPDKDDRCPDTPKGWEVDKFGCPVDRDRDGIPDSEDECPDVAGVAELKGCPWDPPTLMAKYGLNNKNILFDFDKSELRQSGINTLSAIAKVLTNHQDFGVSLVGHTDWTGTEQYNVGLSDRRAMSAKKYLLDNGIQSSRIKTSYEGETNPVADNKTKEGRQLNRRVDYNFFKIK
jgi:OOP family OmpA-OmpF porin